jgi:hypothetical protein
MPSAPAKVAEAIVSFLIPPACREEVVGDLHERYRSPLHYCADALTTIPFVIASRIRRTSDPQILLVHAFSLFLSFLGAATFKDRAFLNQHSSLLRLAIPTGVALVGLILEDAYARRGQRWGRGLARGPFVGIGLALLAEGGLRFFHPELTVPGWILAYGCAMGLVMTTSIRMLFPPPAHQLSGTNVPSDWLRTSSPSLGNSRTILLVIQGIAAVLAVMVVVRWIANQATFPRLLIPLLLFVFALLIANLLWKRRRPGPPN